MKSLIAFAHRWDNLQKLVLAGIDVGEHAQFFQGGNGEVLRFVDNQQRALIVCVALDHEVDKALLQLEPARATGPQAECSRDPLHQLTE